jgi:CRP-like cAMP-binding protein
VTEVAPYRATLADSVVFRGLPPAELEAVLAVSELLTLPRGEAILTEGTPGNGVYVVLEGEVEIFLPQRSGGGVRRPSPIRLNRLGPGRCFGEYGVLDDQPSSASAATVGAAKLAFVPTAKFRQLCEQRDAVGRVVYANLLRFLVARLRSKDKELDLVFVDERA